MSHILALSMSELIPSWRLWVDQMWAGGAGLGLLMVLAGCAFAFLGHSIYPAFCAIMFTLLGWWFTSVVCADSGLFGTGNTIVSLVGAAVLGVLGFGLAKHAVALLGGIAAAGICWQVLGEAGVSERVALVLCVTTLAGVTALAVIRRDEVIVFASAVFGAAMIVSGAVALFAGVPAVGGHYRQLMMRYPVVLWMSFIAPMVIGLAFQLAGLKNKGKAVVQ